MCLHRSATLLPNVLAVLLLLSFASATLADDWLVQHEQALAQGRAEQVYSALIAQEPTYNGQPRFDLLLGVSANETGRLSHAILALTRVVLTEPANALARLELARAFAGAGEAGQARQMLSALDLNDVPAAARSRVAQLQQMIESQLAAQALLAADSAPERNIRRWSAQIELQAGHDDNANAATRAATIALPVFGGVVADLSADARARAASFTSAQAGASGVLPLTQYWGMQASASALQRRNRGLWQADVGYWAAQFGPLLAGSQWSMGLLADLSELRIGHQSTRNSIGGNAIVHLQATPNWLLNLNALAVRLRTDADETRPRAQRQQLAFNVEYGGATDWRGSLGGYTSTEKARKGGARLQDFRARGVRATASIALPANAELSASLNAEERRYEVLDPLLDGLRRDRLFDALLALRMPLWKGDAVALAAVPQLVYSRNQSNLALYSFRRAAASLGLKLDF